MNKVFSKTGSLRPGRSVFNLSYEKKLDCDMGQLIPILADEMIPGDVFKIGAEMVIRMQPLVAPIMHEINAYIHYFFVPARLIDENFEEFITGGTTGETSVQLPRWNPTNNAAYSLWDYLGFPVGVTPAGALPLDYPKRAYNLIYNEYYRDQNFIDEVDITSQESILRRAWEKDYFTSALPWQQRGTAPALPISGITSAQWDTAKIIDNQTDNATNHWKSYVGGLNDVLVIDTNDSYGKQNAIDFLHSNTVDLSNASTFDVSDLRLAFQVQKWLERNARAGARYTEFLKAHYGVSPRDERLQRPEYIGGMKTPVIVSEVLQTSSTDTTSPQGNLAGHGITADRKYIGSYRSTEFGYIMGILSIMPRSAYQQGIDRQWLRRTKYDFYSPEFAFLSEQAIETAELYATSSEADNTDIFGYQGRYNELRYKRNMIVGGMRDIFDYWHLGRKFSTKPELNQSFIECNPDKRIFAVQDEPGMIVNIGNVIKAIRPIPYTSEPGLIDHN